jgi:integrator complex subunit 9
MLELIDLETLDAVIISHAAGLMGLPYLTEYTKFRGRVYATEPVLAFGK